MAHSSGFWWIFKLWLNVILILFLIAQGFSGLSLDPDSVGIENTDYHSESEFSTQFTRANETEINPPQISDEMLSYVIITPSNLTKTIEPLAAWKTKSGVPAKIFTVDGPNGIYSNYPEGDNAAKIHDFLTSMHENNSNLEWVLLVGDEDIIPSRRVFVNAKDPYGLDDYYYSDHYYAGLNNSWDQDSDGIYGEQKGDVNWRADLFVGRLPVNNISEAESAINKILKYETEPETGQWMKNASFWSGLLDAPNNLSAYQNYKDNAVKVTNKVLPHVPNQMTVTHRYDYNQLQGGFYSFNDDTLTKKNIKNDFNSGQTIVSFAGQAYYTGDELAHYFDVAGLEGVPDGFGSLYSYNDGKYSTNGNKLPLMYLSTCSVNFTEPDDSNLEQLITAPDGGVIGLIGNSGKSYRWLNEHFWELFFNGTYQPGKCLYKLKEKYVMEVIYFDPPYLQMTVANLVGYNLLGDPEIDIWTNTPGNLNLSSSIILDESHKLKVIVTNDSGNTVENARVCVYNSEVYEYQVTDSDGSAVLDFDPRLTSELEVTVTAHNFLPFISTFNYENKPPVLKELPELELDEDTILEDAIIFKDYISDPDNTINQTKITISNLSTLDVEVWVDRFNVLQIRPPPNWNGVITGKINVSDGVSSVERPLRITVNPVNDAPKVNEIAPQSVNVSEVFEYQANAWDIDNDELTYSAETNLFDIDSESGLVKFRAKDKNVGKHEINISVSDGNTSAWVIFTLEIVAEEEDNFWAIYWFPAAVILGFIIFVIVVLIVSNIQERKRKADVDKKQTKPKPKSKAPSKKK
jgi:hypothetical protein